MERSLPLAPAPLAADGLGFFRWGRVGGKVLLTNDAADWAFLSEAEFADLLAGRVVAGHPRFEECQSKGFVRDGLDVDALVARVAQRNRHVHRGPYLHVLDLMGGDADAARPMSAATAEAIVELALQTSSPSVVFEFQARGGEPLRNLEVLRHAVQFAQTRNRRSVGKVVRFRLLSNLTAMTEASAEWLIASDVLVSTTLDGPAELHDANRAALGGSPHAEVVRWITTFQRRAAELGRNQQWPIDALVTVTRRSLAAGDAIVDEYVRLGLRSIDLRPLDRTGVDADTWAAIGYDADAYLDFARGVLDAIVVRNRAGVDLVERTASIVVQKILTADDPGVVDLQSPCGAGSGQIVYDVDGRLFPCDEARALDALGEPLFALGEVRDVSLPDVVRHPTVRAIAAASLLDAQPMCADCWNKPFCGVNPVRTFIAQGDLVGQRPHCFECRDHLAISTRLFELLGDAADSAALLARWAAAASPFSLDGRLSKARP